MQMREPFKPSVPARDWSSELLSFLWSLTPQNEETKAVIEWMQRPDVMARLQRLSIETGEEGTLEAYLEAMEMEFDAGELPLVQDKEGRHEVSWQHVEQQLKKMLKK